MSVSMKDLDQAFQGAGQKAGIEVWRIENFKPVSIPKSEYGKFFMGDSYIILKTTAQKSGALHHDLHYWLGKDTSQDEAGTAAIKTIELDAALGGRAVQYREVQGHETEKFLSYFKPCIIPKQGGVASGFRHAEEEEHQTRLFVVRGRHVVNVEEVPFARSSLNHDDIFILDTKSKIFQFNGSNSCIQERAKALEVVQYVKDTYHDGKCDIAAVEDGKLMADAEAGDFWGLFGGFAPLPRKTAMSEQKSEDSSSAKLFRVEKGAAVLVEADSLQRESLETDKCYILDSGLEVFVWSGRGTSLDERKAASKAVDELLRNLDRSKAHVTRVIEGFETVLFRSKFDSWPESTKVTVTEDGRGKVAALLKRQGVNVKGLVKSDSPKHDAPQSFIDCTGDIQVWRVDGQEKTPLEGPDLSKFYSGDCFIFQYSYTGDDKEDYLIGTWFGKQSIEEDRVSATKQASKMVEAMKFVPTQARIFEGHETLQFFTIVQSLIVFKGGLSKAYKKSISEKGISDDTYSEDGLALFRVQGTGPDNMQAIQVEPVASSLNSSYGFILHSGSNVFSWHGNLTTSDDHELVERQLDLIKPEMQSRLQKEGSESEQFWDLLGGKVEYGSKKINRGAEMDPRLFSCTLSRGELKVKEIYNFDQDDLMTEDIFILDCHSDIYVWVGSQVESKNKKDALNVGVKFLERDFLLEKISAEATIYVVTEGNEPTFFTRFFTWDATKFAADGDSYQRKLAILKGTPLQKPKRRTPIFSGRSATPDKSQRSSRSMSVSPDRVRVRGRSPAFNALAATFENPNGRNLSTPPPMVRKIYPKSATPPDSEKPAESRSAAIAALTAGFEKPSAVLIPRSIKSNTGAQKLSSQENVESPKTKPETIEEDVKEGEAEDEEGLTIYPYDRLTTTSTNPAEDIDHTRRETYLSSAEFKEKFKMTKEAFSKLPRWKQNKLKSEIQLF